MQDNSQDSVGDFCSACEGFMYGDLKPENVVAACLLCIQHRSTRMFHQHAFQALVTTQVTSSNHAKLTDFGGCRPITDEAPALPWSQHGANCRHTARHMSHFDLTRLLFK